VQLRALADWLVEHEVDEVVMESTAQYWRPVWEALERIGDRSAAGALTRVLYRVELLPTPSSNPA
jgi:hypothetical protein